MRVQYDCPPLRVYFDLPCTSVRPMRLTIRWRSRTVVIEGFAPAPRPAAEAGRRGNRSLTGTRLVWANGKPEDVYLVERGQAARELDIIVRQATGIAKAKTVAQFARLMVEAGEPVLLVGWHREVYRIWLEALADLKPAMYTGSETAARKEAEKRRFLDGDTDILILSLRAGAGVDGLQHRSSVVILGELDWSPGIHQQILWRLDRECQKNPVTCFLLVTDDGSDPPMMDVLGIKKSEARQIVDPHLGVRIAETDESHLRRLIERYLARPPARVAAPGTGPAAGKGMPSGRGAPCNRPGRRRIIGQCRRIAYS